MKYFCSNCGKQGNDSADYCSSCGYKFASNQTVQNAMRPEANPQCTTFTTERVPRQHKHILNDICLKDNVGNIAYLAKKKSAFS